MKFYIHKSLNYLIGLIILLSLTSCASKLEHYDKPSKNRSFTLTKDVYWDKTGRLFKDKLIYGLRAGTYKLVGENSHGYFYKGSGDDVFFLAGKYSDIFLKTGHIASYKERRKNLAFYGGPGGLWIPKQASRSGPKLYYLVSENGAAVLAGALVGGVIGATLATNTEPTLNIEFNQKGTIIYMPYDPDPLSKLPPGILSD